MLKLNVKTVYALIATQGLPAAKIGGQWRFEESKIRTWIETRYVTRERPAGTPAPAEEDTHLIEEAVGKAEDEVTLNHEVLNNIKEIVGQVHKVSEIMGEIATASEQQGVRQLNTAVGQLNQVTQQTAAHSEEAATGVGGYRGITRSWPSHACRASGSHPL